LVSICVEETTRGWGKNDLKGLKEAVRRVHTGIAPKGKTSFFMRHWVEFSKEFCLRSGKKISPKPNAAVVPHSLKAKLERIQLFTSNLSQKKAQEYL
jgi:hypothetical protein